LQLILPNQVRGQVSALQVFMLNLGGLILGPFLPGFFNDYLFRDARMVGWSPALTVGLASLLSAILFRATWRPYRRHYAGAQLACALAEWLVGSHQRPAALRSTATL
jgi:MFS family permease